MHCACYLQTVLAHTLSCTQVPAEKYDCGLSAHANMATDKQPMNLENVIVAHMHEDLDRASVDMITATNQLQMDATAVRADRPNWAAYLQ